MNDMRCIGRTPNITEAEKMAEAYELRGFRTRVIKKKQGSAFFYEIWVEEKKEGFEI